MAAKAGLAPRSTRREAANNRGRSRCRREPGQPLDHPRTLRRTVRLIPDFLGPGTEASGLGSVVGTGVRVAQVIAAEFERGRDATGPPLAAWAGRERRPRVVVAEAGFSRLPGRVRTDAPEGPLPLLRGRHATVSR